MLLRGLAAATFVLSLGACVQRDYLVADPAGNGVPAGEARYTAFPTSRATAPTSTSFPCASIPPSRRTNDGKSCAPSANGTRAERLRFETAIRVFLDPLGQQCIDKATVAAVARMRGLPLDQLNWCEDSQTAR